MDIKTKYSTSDKVYFIFSNIIHYKYIEKIDIKIWTQLAYNDPGIEIKYGIKIIDNIQWFNEKSLFETKEKLIEKLCEKV